MRDLTHKFQVPLVRAPSPLCRKSAESVAWMGHELLQANQQVDITHDTVRPLQSIPLGSFVKDRLPTGKPKLGGAPLDSQP